jgi:hypothetical protein
MKIQKLEEAIGRPLDKKGSIIGKGNRRAKSITW